MAGYAVVDVETTGLFPGGTDRIVEVAVVHVSPGGERERSWSTLLNPGRDLGPQHVHGIAAADVLGAPTFGDVAGTLAELLAGRVFVAHNASFDARFVAAEYAALGFDVPVVPETCLCTMRWSGRLLGGVAPRTLAGCCAHVGIPLEGAHAALVDATATAELLGYYLRVLSGGGCCDAEDWWQACELAETAAWPAVPVRDVECCVRGASAAEAAVPFLERIVERLPGTCGPAEHQEYLAMLDRALLDRFLSVRERKALVGLADRLGIGRTTAARLHREYGAGLAGEAVADGVVTEDEVVDLVGVAELLGVGADEALGLIEAARRGTGSQSSASVPLSRCSSGCRRRRSNANQERHERWTATRDTDHPGHPRPDAGLPRRVWLVAAGAGRGRPGRPAHARRLRRRLPSGERRGDRRDPPPTGARRDRAHGGTRRARGRQSVDRRDPARP